MYSYKKEIHEIALKQNSIEEKVCAYCGAAAECQDHAMPLTYFACDRDLGNKLFKSSGWRMIDSCLSCNSLAADHFSESFLDRKNQIKRRFKVKFRKVLRQKIFSDDDLDELEGYLYDSVKNSIEFNRFIRLRLENLNNPLPIFAE